MYISGSVEGAPPPKHSLPDKDEGYNPAFSTGLQYSLSQDQRPPYVRKMKNRYHNSPAVQYSVQRKASRCEPKQLCDFPFGQGEEK